METTMEELAPNMQGWHSHFGFRETPEVLIGLTRWVRLRLRAAMWRQWPPAVDEQRCWKRGCESGWRPIPLAAVAAPGTLRRPRPSP
jgi:hypothetical protein